MLTLTACGFGPPRGADEALAKGGKPHNEVRPRGLLFLTPLLGTVIGAASGALLGSLRDIVISEDSIGEVGQNA